MPVLVRFTQADDQDKAERETKLNKLQISFY